MTQPGRAAIEIVGDVSRLGRQVERDAQRALDHVDIDTTHLSTEISDGFRDGAQQGVDELEKIEPDVKAVFDKIANYAEDSAEHVALHFEKGGVRISRTLKKSRDESRRTFLGIGKDADGATDAVGSFARFISSSFSKIGEVLSSVGSSIASTVTSLIDPSSLITIGLQAVGYAALTTVIIGLGAALADLVGLAAAAPAALGVLGTAIGTLIIAFHGFGDAISAVIDGDPDKIAEALKGLAPAARGVVLEFQKLLPQFRELGDLVQQRFFKQISGDLTNLANTLLPSLRRGLGGVSEALGNFVSDFAELGSEDRTVEILNNLFKITAQTINDSRGGIQSFLGGLLEAVDALGPSFATLAVDITNALGSFGEFLSKSAKDGSLQAFFDEAIDTLGRLLDLGGAVGELLGTIFGATDDAGRDFITTLTDLTQRLTEFLKSAEGQRVLERVGDTLKFIGKVAGFVIAAFVLLAETGNDLADIFNAVADFFDRAGNDISDFWTGLVDTVSNAVTAVGDFFSDLWEKIGTVWDAIVDGVSSAIDSIIGFFQSLPGRIVSFIESIPDRVAAVFDAVTDRVIEILGFAIAAVIVFFTDLPGQVVGATQALVQLVTDKFNELKANIATFINEVVTFFRELPTKLGEIGAELIQWATDTWNSVVTTIGEAVGSAIAYVETLPKKFGEFFSQAYAAVRDKVISIVEYVKGIPAKIGAALGNVGRMLYDSGAKIINGLIDGIKSRIGQLKESIANAVQQIRDHLPFSPAKIGPLSGAGSPDIAGAKVAAMIAAGLDSGLPLVYSAAGRTAGAVADAGVTPLTAGVSGQAAVLPSVQTTVQERPVIVVQIGDEEIDAYIDERVDSKVQAEVRRLMAGSRGF